MHFNVLHDLIDLELSKSPSKVLRKDGPLVDVELEFECIGGCRRVRGKGLVDTGADRTAIESTEAQRVGAMAHGSMNAQGVTSESITMPIYAVKLSFPGTTLDAVELPNVAGSPHLKSQGIVALIGRDVLSQSKLSYDGPNGEFSIISKSGSAMSFASSPTVAYGTLAAFGAISGMLIYSLLRKPACPPCEVKLAGA